MDRAKRLAVAAGWVMALGALTSGCAGGSNISLVRRAAPTPSASLTAVALHGAAVAATSATSGRFEITFGVAGDGGFDPGGHDGLSGSAITGEFVGTSSHSRLDAAPTSAAAASPTLETVVAGRTLFARGGLFGAAGAAPWYRIDLGAAGAGDLGAVLGSELNGPAVAGILSGAYGPVDEIGAAEVRGVRATRYRVTVDLATASGASVGSRSVASVLADAAGTRSPVVDVWVGDDHQIRRVVVGGAGRGDGANNAPTAASNVERHAAMRITCELWDLGAPVTVDVPTDARPLDLASALSGLVPH